MVRAVDLDGNADPTPDIYEWLIEGPPDTTAPETIFVAGPPAVTPLFDALVTFTLQRGRRRVRVLDRQRRPFEGCEADRRAHRPPARARTRCSARAIDEAGNVDLTPASHSWTISPAPNTTITATPPNPSPGTTALFSFTSNQTGSRFECSLDDGEWLNCIVAAPRHVQRPRGRRGRPHVRRAGRQPGQPTGVRRHAVDATPGASGCRRTRRSRWPR